MRHHRSVHGCCFNISGSEFRFVLVLLAHCSGFRYWVYGWKGIAIVCDNGWLYQNCWRVYGTFIVSYRDDTSSILVVLDPLFSLQYMYFGVQSSGVLFSSLILFIHAQVFEIAACLCGAWPQEWQVTAFQVHPAALLHFLPTDERGITIVVGMGTVSEMLEDSTVIVSYRSVQMMMVCLLDWIQGFLCSIRTPEFKVQEILFPSIILFITVQVSEIAACLFAELYCLGALLQERQVTLERERFKFIARSIKQRIVLSPCSCYISSTYLASH